MGTKRLWIRLALINLFIVALLGFTLRSKILFSIPYLDYRNVLSAHSHFAFSGWVGLALFTLLVFDILPQAYHQKRIYTWILAGTEISSLGMALSFPLGGYNVFSIIFSSLYIFITYVFAAVYIRDLVKARINNTVTLLSICAISSLVISSIGPFTLSYIMITKSGDSLLYRDSIYTFLHFQYNGFFTLSVFALLANILFRDTNTDGRFHQFARLLCLSILPSLFLSLLWHNNPLYYILGGIGALFLLLSLIAFIRFILKSDPSLTFNGTARRLFQLALLSFGIKMLLNLGTIFPSLANEVYGDRPVIIGFLHLVFLGFISFYLLATFVQQGIFSGESRTYSVPIVLFGSGIILNEILLMLQGLGILFKTNSNLFNWFLWGASIILMTGALYTALVQLSLKTTIKKP